MIEAIARPGLIVANSIDEVSHSLPGIILFIHGLMKPDDEE